MPEGDRYPRPTAVLALSSGGEHRGTHVRLDPLPTHDAAPASHPRQWTLRRPDALCRLALRAAGFAARPRYLSALSPRKMLRIRDVRSEEHTSELQSLMRISYAVFSLNKQNTINTATYSVKRIWYDKT